MRPAVRLLTAVARYQVGGAVVEDYRLSRVGGAPPWSS